MQRLGQGSFIGMLLLGALAPDGAGAQEDIVYKYVHCDVEYVIQPGDTLESISRTAYGEAHAPLNAQLIFSRNVGLIELGEALPVGVAIIVPCKPDEAAFYPDEDELITADDDDAELPAPPAGPPVRILTSGLAPPFVDTSLRGEGLTAKIVNSALAAGAAASDPNVEIAYVNDRSAHLRDLLDRGSFAMGFPWAMPPCADAALATSMPLEAWMCGAFEFSDPIFEYFQSVLVSETRALQLTSLSDLEGLRVCLLDREPKTQLTYAGVTVDNTDFTIAEEADRCLSLLQSGEVDIAILDPLYLPRDGAPDIREVVELTYLVTLHAVAPISKPETAAQLARLNLGLSRIRESGAWFDIVAPHLVR